MKTKSEALSRETLGRRKLFRKKRKDKIPNLVASYDHAMGAAGTILTLNYRNAHLVDNDVTF